MKAILTTASEHEGTPNIETVAVPGLGTGAGGLSPQAVSLQMREAY